MKNIALIQIVQHSTNQILFYYFIIKQVYLIEYLGLRKEIR